MPCTKWGSLTEILCGIGRVAVRSDLCHFISIIIVSNFFDVYKNQYLVEDLQVMTGSTSYDKGRIGDHWDALVASN